MKQHLFCNILQEKLVFDLIEVYKNKYPRHTAFKSELKQALQGSGLFSGTVQGRRGIR